MTSYIKDLGEVLYDDTHIVMTQAQCKSLNHYNNIMQPTNPSVGRAFRAGGTTHGTFDPESPGLVVFVEEDPEPGYVLRRGRIPLFLDEG